LGTDELFGQLQFVRTLIKMIALQ